MNLPEGVYAAAVTPRRRGMQDINLGAMWDLLDFLSDRKVDGIVLLGATGEFIHFSNAERMRVTGLAPRRSRVPVIINVSHSTLDGAVELAQAAAASGAAAVLLMPPYFFRYSDDYIRTFYMRFAQESDIAIPTLVYNIPQFGNRVSPTLVAELIERGVVAGVKDSSGEWDYFSQLLAIRERQSFTLMVGNDSLFTQAYPNGITGTISGVACALPELMVSLRKALATGSQPKAAALETRLREFIGWIDRMPVPIGIREAVCLRGQKPGPAATLPSPEAERIIGEFTDWFKPWLKQVLAECGDA